MTITRRRILVTVALSAVLPFVFALLGLVDMRLREAPAQQNYSKTTHFWVEHRWPFGAQADVVWGNPRIRATYMAALTPKAIIAQQVPTWIRTKEPNSKSIEVAAGWPYPVVFGSAYQPREVAWPIGDSEGRPQIVHETTIGSEGLLLDDENLEARSILPTPRWWPLLSQMLLFGAVLLGPQLVYAGVLHIRRRRKGLCRRCGYPITEPVCPECGGRTD